MESKCRKELSLLRMIRKYYYYGNDGNNDNSDDDDDGVDVKISFYKFVKGIMR